MYKKHHIKNNIKTRLTVHSVDLVFFFLKHKNVLNYTRKTVSCFICFFVKIFLQSEKILFFFVAY